uniref:Uncharacterized protein n=1 Tax=Brassica oleracea var. oleracea TaxID=109376 RepID=A0A0D3DI81_BRAOL
DEKKHTRKSRFVTSLSIKRRDDPNLLHLPPLDLRKKKKGDPMGGGAENGHGGDFRAKVWSMSGGPYCRPKHWRRNTAFAMFGVFLVCIPIAMKSAELEQRPHMPVRPIPSQIWCKNFGTKDDYEKEH